MQIESLFLIYFSEHNHTYQSLNLYLSLILITLTNLVQTNDQNHISAAENQEIILILKYIDRHYATLTLEQLAKKFG